MFMKTVENHTTWMKSWVTDRPPCFKELKEILYRNWRFLFNIKKYAQNYLHFGNFKSSWICFFFRIFDNVVNVFFLFLSEINVDIFSSKDESLLHKPTKVVRVKRDAGGKMEGHFTINIIWQPLYEFLQSRNIYRWWKLTNFYWTRTNHNYRNILLLPIVLSKC